jgi:ubiquinone/menaquinone biosynthesis C-methylase UbiE
MSWDQYAPFYDWENARTMGRRDLQFWKRFVLERPDGRSKASQRSLELGCGTGRLLIPLARTVPGMVGVDFSAAMLARARLRLKRVPVGRRPRLVRGDIRALPFPDRSFDQVLAPYGVLQSLTSDADFDATLAETARLLRNGGRFGLELIPELAKWQSYQRQVRFRGKLGRAQVTLVESVRQDRRRGLTIFDEEFTVREGGRARRHRFPLTFRTMPMDIILEKLGRTGFDVEAVLGSYRGAVWTPDSPASILIARSRQPRVAIRNRT